MTHEELLEEINWAIQEYDKAYDNTNYYYTALRAVVELHKPYESTNAGLICEFCVENDSRDHRYPCPTIQAIEKELG